MSEGGTYLCGWSYESGAYRAWVEERPTLQVVGEDFSEVADELAARVGDWCGDGEAVLEFPGGRPGDVGPGVLARFRSLGYNESVRILNPSATLYDGGACSRCGFGIGRRSSVELQVSGPPKGDIAGVDRTYPWSLLVSEHFLNLLSPPERSRIEVQPVSGKGRKVFFEIVGKPVSHVVGVAGAEYVESFHRSWCCGVCARRMLTVEHPDYASDSVFLDAEEVPSPAPEVFVFDEGHRLGVAISETRWRELAPEVTGVSTTDLLMIPAGLAVREPDLPRPEEFDWV